MATPRCPHCQHHILEVPPVQKIGGYSYPLNFIQCAKCGSVVGVMPEYDPGVLANQNKTVLADVQTRLTRIEALLAAMQGRP